MTVRPLDPGRVRRALWSERAFVGLHANLATLPPERAARMPLHMAVERPQAFAPELEAEAATLDGAAADDVRSRAARCRTGVETLMVARDEATAAPVFCQWWLRDPAMVEAWAPGLSLPPGVVLVEGAYTFAAFRRLGVMRAGMAQLLRAAHGEGAVAAVTYVAPDNVASLRACAQVGFLIDHERADRRRLGRHLVRYAPAGRAAVDGFLQAAA